MKIRIPTEAERLQFFAPQRETMPLAEVLAAVAPVRPDHLAYEGRGVYEAGWRDVAVGAGEIVRLCEMRARVVVISECPHRPEGLPDGIAVRFCILALPCQSSDLVH